MVNWLAQYKPKQLTKQGLVKPVLEALCKLCAEPDPEDHDDEDQLSAAKFAAQVQQTPFPCVCSMLAQPQGHASGLFWSDWESTAVWLLLVGHDRIHCRQCWHMSAR